MFNINLKQDAARQFKKLKSYYAAKIMDSIETHLRHEPEKPSKTTIKKLRGRQKATYRLRVGDYRVFYDVGESTVTITTILHKSETEKFYEKENTI